MIIYLYIKQCQHCGLKYFGKTTSSDPFKYLGSGKIWKRHFNKHGKEHIVTIGIYQFDNQEKATKFALEFSRRHNIVESIEWANLVPEDAMNGFDGSHLKGRTYEEIHGIEKAKILRKNKSETFLGVRSKLKDRTYEEIHGIEKAKILKKSRSDKNPGKNMKDSTKLKIGKTRKEKYASGEIVPWNKGKNQPYNGNLDKVNSIKWICPHCNKSGTGLGNKNRWHFENCKLAP